MTTSHTTKQGTSKPEMDIPIGAAVECTDGLCGKSTYIVVDPTTQQVTHLVVRARLAPHVERLVPREEIIETTPHLIRLRCASDRLAAMPPFVKTGYRESDEAFRITH